MAWSNFFHRVGNIHVKCLMMTTRTDITVNTVICRWLDVSHGKPNQVWSRLIQYALWCPVYCSALRAVSSQNCRRLFTYQLRLWYV